ncbi:TPA: hypothetical protein ACH3X1_001671 [Trebouxia sp. C0004]
MKLTIPGWPPVVHCSAGIGRTGTFVAIDVVMKRLRHLDAKDVKGELRGSADVVCIFAEVVTVEQVQIVKSEYDDVQVQNRLSA